MVSVLTQGAEGLEDKLWSVLHLCIMTDTNFTEQKPSKPCPQQQTLKTYLPCLVQSAA